MKIFSPATVLIGVLLVLPANATTLPGDPPPMIVHQLQEATAKRATLANAKARGLMTGESWAPQLGPSPIDVLHYDLELHLDPQREVLSGIVEVEVAAVTNNLQEIVLDADQGLRVISTILVQDVNYPHDGPQELAFSHTDDRLAVTLHRPLPSGEKVRIMISYGGRGGRSGYGVSWNSLDSGAPLITTTAEPFGSRLWWPCNDRPDDKATVDLAVSAAAELTVASNGLQTGRVVNPDGTATTRWSSRYPVATYLVVMNVSDFVFSEQTYHASDGTTMPVVLYAYPENAAEAESDLAETPEMIAVLEAVYGGYPFIEEKYGNCITPRGGAMEHQTLTSMGQSRVGTERIRYTNVHELGHQWWGDWVTLDDWRDLWLNEGFATATEWIWASHLGENVVDEYRRNSDWIGQFFGPVYDNPVPFSSTVYRKGAWVLYMLVKLTGDEATAGWIASYRQTYGGSSATTEDLRAIIETESGSDLGWFFDQWVYGVNRPRYQYSWSAIAGPAVRLTVNQKQTNAPLFRMPMEVLVSSPAGDEVHQVWVEAEATQTFDIPVLGPASQVVLDPFNHVLCEIGPSSAPDLDFGPDFPGPFDLGTVELGSSQTITIPLSNLGGSELIISDIFLDSDPSAFVMLSPTQFPVSIQPDATLGLEIAFSPTQAGTDSDWLDIQSNDPSRYGYAFGHIIGTGVVAPEARLSAATSLAFGAVPLGGTAEALLWLGNHGGSDLSLDNGVLQGNGFTLPGTLPATLEPGENVQVAVRFTPTAVGLSTGTLELPSNDASQPEFVIALSGEGTAAARITTPGMLTFGLVEGTTDRALSIGNSGSIDLVVSALAIDPPFALVDPWQLPRTISPGASLELGLQLTDTSPGTAEGKLRILSNDPSLPWALVALSGHVAAGPTERHDFPAVVQTTGIGGAEWTSDGVFLNPTAQEIAIDLEFLPASDSKAQLPHPSLSLPPGHQRRIANLVGALGATGAGGLELFASGAGVVAVSRTFAQGDSGGYGQHIAAVAEQEGLVGEVEYLLPGLAGNDGFHTNLGLLNISDQPITVEFTLHDSDGASLGTVDLTAAGAGFAQSTTVFASLSGAAIRGAFARLSCPSAGARFLAYASVVDDASHDPTLVTPLAIAEDGPLNVVIPVVASNSGQNGTFWRSELAIVNTGQAAADVQLTLHLTAASAPTIQVQVAAGQSLFLPQVVGESFGQYGSGWLRLTSPAQGIYASSRLFNDNPSGTYGQNIPAIAFDELLTAGESAVLPGLRSADGFRSNLGITSLAEVDVEVDVRVYLEDGELAGELRVAVPALSFVQVGRLLGHLGIDGWAWATLGCDATQALFAVHASVVDGQSGDPAFIPAVRTVE